MKRLLFPVLAIVAFFSSCNFDTAVDKFIYLALNTQQLEAEGGTFTLTVTSSGVKWKVSEQPQLASATGTSFLSDFTPVYAGTETGPSAVEVTFTAASNTSVNARSTAIQVISLDGEMSANILLYQAGKDTPSETKLQVTLDHSLVYQTIDGFGGMNNWGDNNYLTNKEIDKLFATDDGLGMNILRIRISPNEDNWKNVVASCKYAIDEYDALILASPWSAPASMKTNNSVNGNDATTGKGSLKDSCYQAYAEYLEKFAAMMKDQGAPLYAISVQNEPDWPASYEGCLWTAEQNCNFIRDYGHLITSALLVSGESMQMKHDFYKPMLNDALACSNVDIVAGHIYGVTPSSFALAEEKGKHVWMTEHLLNDSWTNKTDHWTETMDMVTEINGCLLSGWSAYIWWYAKRYYSFIGDGEEGTTSGAILPRGYAFGQFSKYIRSGYERISAVCNQEGTDVQCSAFQGNDRTVVILINTSSSAREVTVSSDVDVASTYATTTSSFKNSVETEVTVNESEASLTLRPSSITTLVLYQRDRDA